MKRARKWLYVCACVVFAKAYHEAKHEADAETD